MGEFIQEIKGDLLESQAKVRCHQVNCRGVMGAGLAKQVKEKYPEVYEQYHALCDQFGSLLLGHTQFVVCHDGTVMANLFAQDDYGTSKVQTNLAAMDECLAQVAAFCHRVNEMPAFPKLLGCGLAGGDWGEVSGLIANYFDFKGSGCLVVEKESAKETASEKPEQTPMPENGKITDVTIYTDGSCRFNPGPGGWGAVLIVQGKDGKVEKKISGGKEESTNQEMELTAVKEALSILKRPCEVTLYSDSAYVVNSISKGWLEGWKQKGWKKKGGIANLELWQDVYELLQKHKVTCVWVKGHADNFYNNMCDQMAQAQSANFL